MEIKSHSKNYQVIFEENYGFISSLSQVEQSLWIIDKKVFELYENIIFESIENDRIMLIEATEKNKVIETALQICERMTLLSAKRNSTIISVGGGIVQDITGFAANILYRGVKWIFVPTTLLAACDSCIGSKTSLNYKSFKNLLGTFYPPDELHIYPEVFKTLSEIDYLSGMGEVVKFNIMAGRNDFKLLYEDLPLLLQRDIGTIIKYVHKSLEFKKKFIEEDEYDKGKRILLNYAHTFGHALETVSDYAIPHGTAVALGTIIADNISFARGWISAEINLAIQNILLKIIDINLLETYNDLDTNCMFDIEGILKAISKDKKQISGSMTAILFADNNLELKVVHNLERIEVEKSIKETMDLLQIGRVSCRKEYS